MELQFFAANYTQAVQSNLHAPPNSVWLPTVASERRGLTFCYAQAAHYKSMRGNRFLVADLDEVFPLSVEDFGLPKTPTCCVSLCENELFQSHN